MYTVNAQVLDENGVEIWSLSVPATQSELIEDGCGGPGLQAVTAVLLAPGWPLPSKTS